MRFRIILPLGTSNRRKARKAIVVNYKFELSIGGAPQFGNFDGVERILLSAATFRRDDEVCQERHGSVFAGFAKADESTGGLFVRFVFS